MTYPRNITTEVEAAVLEHADRLAAIIGKHWHPANDTDRDDVMLLVADLLRAHAETGIEMQTWRTALDVVMDHLAAEPEGADLLHRLGRPTWFTVIGTTKSSHREAVAIIPGRRHLETAIGAWATQVQAPTAADAVSAAVSKHLQHTYLAAPTGNDAQPREAVRRTDRCLLDDRSGDESRFYAHQADQDTSYFSH